MELIVHPDRDRGRADHGWLSTRHSFSFGGWYEPTRMGFGKLRVVNDDTIAAHSGFGAHPHKDMEIITIVMDGTLTHRDSMGNTGTIPAGDVQVMSAGTGVVHSEYNDGEVPLKLFQVWVEPNEKGVPPRYGQQGVGFSGDRTGSTLLAAPLGADDQALGIHQDAYVHFVSLGKDGTYSYRLHDSSHGLYAFVVEGVTTVAGTELGRRDAAGITGAEEVLLATQSGAELLLFEVPMV